jgi:hypothetical protein
MKMKKIMFNDAYGLTDAVLQGRKTMTRRIARFNETERPCQKGRDKCLYCKHYDREIGCKWLLNYSPYKVDEVVAIAQSYKALGYTKEWVEQHISPNPNAKPTDPFEKKYPGWSNKMNVPAELNKAHQIRITGIKVERLQNISDEDCFKEGITTMTEGKFEAGNAFGWDIKIDALKRESFFTPRAAFAALIDNISGKGTWELNPYVFAYTFELLK